MKKQGVMALALLLAGGTALGCSEKGAFGVEFGTPVPNHASKTQRDGGSVKNAMGFFDGDVPQPLALPGYKHGYGANRDRSFVYAVEAKRSFFDLGAPTTTTTNEEFKAAVKTAIEEVIQIKNDWEQRFGLEFESDYEDGHSWTADTGVFTARVYIFSASIHVECSHNALMSKAFSTAMKGGW